MYYDWDLKLENTGIAKTRDKASELNELSRCLCAQF